MSNKYKILELLKVDKLTVKEIVDKTEFKENDVRTYIHRLLKDNLIKQIGKKDRYCLYEAVENDSIELLKQLYNFMSNEKKCVLNEVDESDLDLMNRIKEVIK